MALSPVWRNVGKALDALGEGFKFKLEARRTPLWEVDWLGCGPLAELVDMIHYSNLHLQVGDICDSDTWCIDNISTSIPMDIKDQILATMPPSGSNLLDHLTWVGNSSWKYTAASGYNWLRSISQRSSSTFSLCTTSTVEDINHCQRDFQRWRINLLLDEDKWDIRKVFKCIETMIRELHIYYNPLDAFGSTLTRSRVLWTAPPLGSVKMNTHGSFDADRRTGSFGCGVSFTLR
ncbi:hypothetical protein SESBI_39229 [Sesbania bispinosa]|nr:hypothetical protein SESBI_39229 [Sesbania bispinosa]